MELIKLDFQSEFDVKSYPILDDLTLYTLGTVTCLGENSKTPKHLSFDLDRKLKTLNKTPLLDLVTTKGNILKMTASTMFVFLKSSLADCSDRLKNVFSLFLKNKRFTLKSSKFSFFFFF